MHTLLYVMTIHACDDHTCIHIHMFMPLHGGIAINVSVQHNGGFLPDMILLTQCYYHRGTRLNLQPMIAPKRVDIFSPRLGDAQKVKMRSDFSLN